MSHTGDMFICSIEYSLYTFVKFTPGDLDQYGFEYIHIWML